MRDYIALAEQYVDDVLSGRRPACKWERLACQRHRKDLERQGTDAFPYAFNPELVDAKGKAYRPALRVCAFAELQPHIKGDWAARGERIHLQGWQAFILASIFGWVHQHTQKRRFRVADLYVPRKNAKSTLAAVIGLYMLAADGEHGAEVYSGATSRDQALEVFRPARLMANGDVGAAYRAHYGVLVNVTSLVVLDTNSKFEPVIGNPGDGASPSCALVDEYHEHTSSELYDTMRTGMGARRQPLLLMITTAGSNIGGPCYQHQVELQKMLEGVQVDETRFGIVYGIDAGDDWTQPEALIKANPNFGVSVFEDFLLTAQLEAVRDPRKAAVFKTKHLNVWVAAASPWLNLENLQRCADPALNAEDFRGETCWTGTDLASKNDIASKAKVFRRLIDNDWHYYAFTRNWLPQAAVQKPENGHYQAWVEQGHLVQTSGNMIDLRQIQEDIEADSELHVVAEVAMDAWGSREISPALQAGGFEVVDVPMTTKNLSEPMKLIAALVDAGRFHFDGNLATVWMLANVEVFEDRNENVFPRKSKAENKIDAAIAIILAVGRAMQETPDPMASFMAYVESSQGQPA
jgi:phage terminase large subunit-like protein